jgi:hypothetical protein
MEGSAKPNRENLITWRSMPESNNDSGKGLELLEWISDELTILAEAFGEPLTEQRQEIYCAGLADIPKQQLHNGFRRARYELKWFPKLSELRELAGALPGTLANGRPGPEEAWARMPKGNRMEEDSVVWCDEERVAYSACRPLLLEGDLIGARMAFKERYEKELAEVRSTGKPPRWSVSVGYDVEHRLSTLATAVEQNRLTLASALNFVSPERQNDFAQLLPPAEAKGLLTGGTGKLPDLPGLTGVLANMQMDGNLPDGITASPRPHPEKSANLTPEQSRARRDELKSQAEFLKRSRNGSGSDAA